MAFSTQDSDEVLSEINVTPLVGEIPWLAENPENAATGKYINLALL